MVNELTRSFVYLGGEIFAVLYCVYMLFNLDGETRRLYALRYKDRLAEGQETAIKCKTRMRLLFFYTICLLLAVSFVAGHAWVLIQGTNISGHN